MGIHRRAMSGKRVQGLKLSGKRTRKQLACAQEITALLGCYAKNAFDETNCKKFAEALMLCQTAAQKRQPRKSTLNYQMGRLQRTRNGDVLFSLYGYWRTRSHHSAWHWV